MFTAFAAVALADTAPAPSAKPPGHPTQAQIRTAVPAVLQAPGGDAATFVAQLDPVSVQSSRGASKDDYLANYSSTATHTDTPLLDIPLSIQAIPDKLLRDQGAQSLEDALRNAPGVFVQQGEGNRDQFLIRGISTKSDFFVNGLRDDSEYFRDLYNIEQVDVLQGPSALLFGRGDAGGVINLVTKQPERRPIRELNLSVGSDGLLRSTADVGDALGEHAAWRVNLMDENSGGFRDFAFLRRHGVNPTLAFGLGTDTRLYLGVEDYRDQRLADRGIPSDNGHPANMNRTAFFGSPLQNVAEAHVDSVSARLEHDFNDQVEFRNSLRVSQNRKFYRNLFPGSSVLPGELVKLSGYQHHNTRKSYLDQAEFVTKFATGRVHHELLTGADFAWQMDNDWVNLANPASYPVTVPLADPTVNDVAFNLPSRNNHASGHELGFYAQDQMAVSPRWLAIAGARWDRFSLDADYHLVTPSTPNVTQRTDTAWTPRAGLIYKPVANDSLYVSYTKSYTPVGANLALSAKSPAGQNLAPQDAINYEIGNKLDLFERQLSVTAALFQLDLSNVPATDPLDPSIMVLTGAQRMRGVELTATGHLTERWNIAANYTWMTAGITRSTSAAPAGAEVGLVPRNAASLWSSYAVNEHWGFGAGLSGRGRVYTSFSNQVMLPGYVLADAMLYYRSERYRLQLNFDNLLDAAYYPSANGDNQIMPGAPSRVMLNVRVNF